MRFDLAYVDAAPLAIASGRSDRRVDGTQLMHGHTYAKELQAMLPHWLA